MAIEKVPWEIDPDSGEKYVEIPDVCGPSWWAMLHNTAAAIRDAGCSHCGVFAVDAMVALHDLVNVKLGKPVQDQANLERFALKFKAATNPQGLQVAQPETVTLEAATEKQFEAITNSIIQKMQEGVIPWRKPWATQGLLPYNAISGRPYRGLNVLILGMTEFEDPRWLTFNQTTDKGGHIRRGEKSQKIFFWKVEVKDTDELDDEGEPIKQRLFLFRMYSVFNVQQAEDLNMKPLERIEHEPLPEAEHIVEKYLARSGVNLEHSAEDRAFYQPAIDRLHMPFKSAFPKTEQYFCTLFHEFGHSTGHKTRLNREVGSDPFGSPIYSKEELVAEFCSAFLCGQVGVDNLEPSAAYIQNWLTVLKNDPSMLVFGASAGQAAAEYILEGGAEDQPVTSELVEVAQALAVQPSVSMGNAFLGFIVTGIGLGLGFAISNLLVSHTKAKLGQRQGLVFSDALELDVSGQGDFVREVVQPSDRFDPDSFRTVEEGTHRVIIGCPVGQWSGEECDGSTELQTILHPKEEQDGLVLDAIDNGIPIIDDDIEKVADFVERMEPVLKELDAMQTLAQR